MDIQICGSFDNGTKECCKYCVNFFLWGTSTGYCGVKNDDCSTWDNACEKFEFEEYDEEYC